MTDVLAISFLALGVISIGLAIGIGLPDDRETSWPMIVLFVGIAVLAFSQGLFVLNT